MARVDALACAARFSRLENVLEVPNLIDIQRSSFDWLVDTEKGGLRETINDVSPIEDYTGNLAVVFEEIKFDEPVASISECREKDLTYSRPLTVKVAFQNRETGEIREQSVFMGDFPWMTERGTFIINGTERVVVTQLVAFAGRLRDGAQGPREAGLHREPDAGPRLLARARDRQEGPGLRPYRPQAQAAGHRAAACDGRRAREGGFAPSWTTTRNPRSCSTTRSTSATRSRPTPRSRSRGGLADRALQEAASGRAAVSRRARKNLLNQLFFDPKRYDLTRVGRYKLNTRLHLDEPLDTRTLTPRDIVELIKELVSLPSELGIPEDGLYEGEPIKDYAAEAQTYAREPIEERLDEYEHFGNRRLRTVGELIQEAFRIGLYRMERIVRERLTTEDSDTITPQTIINIRPVVAALKEFFGSSQLSQFMDQTNSLSGLTHRRRLSALGAGGLTRERAPIEVRDVHPTHYGRMCPIETPEGPNIGLIGSLSSLRRGQRARLRHDSVPLVDGRRRHRRDRPPRRQPGGGQVDRPGERRDRREDRQVQGPQVTCRSRGRATCSPRRRTST